MATILVFKCWMFVLVSRLQHGMVISRLMSWLHEVFMMGLWYNAGLCCVESNNHGLTTITQLRHLGYPNIVS